MFALKGLTNSYETTIFECGNIDEHSLVRTFIVKIPMTSGIPRLQKPFWKVFAIVDITVGAVFRGHLNTASQRILGDISQAWK